MWLIAIGVIIISNGYCNAVDDPIVSTNVGIIRGRHATDGNYAMYLGIPYAQINRENPFGDSIPQPPFSNFDIFDAIDDSVICPQEEESNTTLAGSLDCLQLNVYVPVTASAQNKLPVMVWIHGGSFVTGSKGKLKYGPKYLVQHNVIIVTINYRLGPYGFMCLDIPEVPGNEGLKDQQAALKWVKNNIAGFGGDNNNIAIAGESAGAKSVDLQFRFNKDDSFHKVIMESGSASSSMVIQPADTKLAIKLATQLGFKTDISLDAVKYLSTVDPSNVIAASLALGTSSYSCTEKEFDGVTRFVHDYSFNIDIPKAKNTPILLGVNDAEWVVYYLVQNAEYFETLDIFRTNLNIAFNLTTDELKEMEDIIKRFYLGGDTVSIEKFVEIGLFESDYRYIHPAKMSIDEYIANGATTVYNYLFSYSGGRNLNKVKVNTTLGGAFHADEIGYLFDVFELEEPNEEDKLMIDRMTTMWTNFIKYGDPTPEGATDLLPVKWPKVTAKTSSYLSIDSAYNVSSKMFHDRMAFWDLIYLINNTKRIGYNPT